MSISPKQTAQNFAYLGRNDTIAAAVNREWGSRYSTADIARFLRAKPVGARRKVHVEGALTSNEKPIKAGHGKGYDPLALALFKYHARRSEGETQAYWLQLAA